MKIFRRSVATVLLLIIAVIVFLTIRASFNDSMPPSSEISSALLSIIYEDPSITKVLDFYKITDLDYLGNDTGIYSNGINFYSINQNPIDMLLVYWDYDRNLKKYSIRKVVLKRNSVSQIIWESTGTLGTEGLNV